MTSAGRRRVARGLAIGAFTVLLLGIGGSLFEHLAVDTRWPENARIIQPEAGGIQRKYFWMPFHMAATLLLAGALWAAWPEGRARNRILLAAGLYLVMRVWSFLYFIPAALRFETRADWGAADALQWIWLSVLRLPLMIAAAAGLLQAAKQLGSGAQQQGQEQGSSAA